MRVSVPFLPEGGGTVDAHHYVARNQSVGWTGELATSPFVKRREQLVVPDGAARLMVTLASGGVTGRDGHDDRG